MDSPVYISYFNTETRGQFLASSRQFLGSRFKTTVPAGAIVVLVDLDAREVYGLVRVRNAPDNSSPCIEHAWLDVDTYSEKYQQYNRYDVYIHEVHILQTTLSFAHICFLVGGDMTSKGNGNMWKKNHINFARPFQVGAAPEVAQRYTLCMNMLMV
jgi:hypothetical protein